MSAAISPELRAARSRAGKLGTLRRWGGRRIVRLDTLDPTVRAVVLNLVETNERVSREMAAGDSGTPAADVEGTRDADHAA